MTARACPVCSFNSAKPLYRQRFAPIAAAGPIDGYTVVACDQCGMLYADGIPSDAVLSDYYRNASKYTYAERNGQAAHADSTRLFNTAVQISNYLTPESTILDIGCATGLLLKHLRSLGFDGLMGLDLSPECVEIARRLYDVRVDTTTTEQFDAVTLVGVLEHVRDVHGLLRFAADRIRGRGHLYIEVPDALGFCDFPTAPYQELSVEHINYFTPATLQRALTEAGFAIDSMARSTVTRAGGLKVPNIVVLAQREAYTDGEASMQLYLAQSEAAERVWRERIRAIEEPFIVWGCGTLTRSLVAHGAFDSAGSKIMAFTDNDARYHGRSLNGVPIIAPAMALAARTEPFLIVTDGHHIEIADQIEDAGRRVLDPSPAGVA